MTNWVVLNSRLRYVGLSWGQWETTKIFVQYYQSWLEGGKEEEELRNPSDS